MIKRYMNVGGGMIQLDNGAWVIHSDYAALEARCAGLERERDELKSENERLDKESDEYLKQRDDSESDIGRIAAAIGQDLSSAYGVPHLIDDIEELDASHDRLTAERDALQAKLAAAEEALRGLCNRIVDRHGAPDGNGGHIVRSRLSGNCAYCDQSTGHSGHCVLGMVESSRAIFAGHAPATKGEGDG